MQTPLRRNDVVGAIGVIVLLLGTATGSAYVMFGMSATAIILLLVVYRQQVTTGAIFAAFAAAVTVAFVAIASYLR